MHVGPCSTCTLHSALDRSAILPLACRRMSQCEGTPRATRAAARIIVAQPRRLALLLLTFHFLWKVATCVHATSFVVEAGAIAYFLVRGGVFDCAAPRQLPDNKRIDELRRIWPRSLKTAEDAEMAATLRAHEAAEAGQRSASAARPQYCRERRRRELTGIVRIRAEEGDRHAEEGDLAAPSPALLCPPPLPVLTGRGLG